MPAISRTILPRIRKSIERRGFMETMKLSFFAPLRLAREYKSAHRNYSQPAAPDAFDIAHGTETSARVDRSDLRVNSSNWISAAGYWPTQPDIFAESISTLCITHQDFV